MRNTRCGSLLFVALFIAGCPEDDLESTEEDSGSVVAPDSAVAVKPDAAQDDDEPDAELVFDADVDIDAGEEPDPEMGDGGVADAAHDAELGADAGTTPDASALDSGVKLDAGALDAGTTDAGALDSGIKLDAGTSDAGIKLDAGTSDAGVKLDAGTSDAGSADSGVKADAGTTDAGASDAGASDSGIKPDAGSDAGTADAGALDAGAPDAATPTNTFTAAYAVISANCLGCHGSGNGSGNLQMGTKARAYDELVGGPLGNPTGAAEGQCLASGKRRVIAFEPANSLIIQKLTGVATCGSSIMPPNSGGIAVGQIAVIQAWITAGALND